VKEFGDDLNSPIHRGCCRARDKGDNLRAAGPK